MEVEENFDNTINSGEIVAREFVANYGSNHNGNLNSSDPTEVFERSNPTTNLTSNVTSNLT